MLNISNIVDLLAAVAPLATKPEAGKEPPAVRFVNRGNRWYAEYRPSTEYLAARLSAAYEKFVDDLNKRIFFGVKLRESPSKGIGYVLPKKIPFNARTIGQGGQVVERDLYRVLANEHVPRAITPLITPPRGRFRLYEIWKEWNFRDYADAFRAVLEGRLVENRLREGHCGGQPFSKDAHVLGLVDTDRVPSHDPDGPPDGCKKPEDVATGTFPVKCLMAWHGLRFWPTYMASFGLAVPGMRRGERGTEWLIPLPARWTTGAEFRTLASHPRLDDLSPRFWERAGVGGVLRYNRVIQRGGKKVFFTAA